MNQTLTLTTARRHPRATRHDGAPRDRAQWGAAGAILRGTGAAARWLVLAAAAPELLIDEQRRLEREMRDDARRDG